MFKFERSLLTNRNRNRSLCVLCNLSSAKEHLTIFAILDIKFANIREVSFARGRGKEKITEFRDVVSKIRDSGYKIREYSRG